MSEKYNREKYGKGKAYVGITNLQSGADVTPHNCKTPCVYGKGREFCYPCMAKILSESRAAA
jgi:hypothetical protein